MPSRYRAVCGPGQCPYFMTDYYRKNPEDRRSGFVNTSHVARRWCTVDGGKAGYDVACHIRPDDEDLLTAASGGSRFVDFAGEAVRWSVGVPDA